MTKSIFISSTSKDLIEHRAAVKHAIERLEHRAIDMAAFGSQPGDAVEVSLSQVRKADIYVGIIAHRYGYIPDGHDKSVTQMEYEEAVRRGIPRLMYLVNPDCDWYALMAGRLMRRYNVGEDEVRAILIEQNPAAQQKLFQFKIRVEKENVRSLFDTEENLANQVSADIARLLTVQSRRRRVLALVVPLLAVLLFGLLMYASSFPLKNQFVESMGWATPTPLEGQPAVGDEIVVVVTEFQKSDGIQRDPELNILDVVRQAAREVGDARVIAVGHPVSNEDEARAVAELYRATVVIYGRIAAGGVIVGYQVMPYAGTIMAEVEGDFRISSDQVENFETFLFNGMNANFIVGLTAGQLLYYKNDEERAVRAYTLAIDSLDETQNDQLQAGLAYAFRGSAYRRLEQWDLARADYEKALELDPDLAMAYAGRGTLYRRLGEFEQALADHNRAVELAPDDPYVYFGRAGHYVDTRQYDLALADYEKAQELNFQPADWIPNELSRLYSAAGDYDKAMEYARIAYEMKPDDYFNLSRMGYAHYRFRELEQARAYFERALQQRPGDYYMFAAVGDTYLAEADDERAQEWYEKALQQKPDYDYAILKLGLVYRRRGDYEQALSHYQEAADRGSVSALVSLAYMHERGLGVPQDYDEAYRLYRMAADANDPYAQFNIGTMYENGNGVPQDYGEALRWYRLAADQHDTNAMVAIGALYRNGRGVPKDIDETVRWYEMAASRHNPYAYGNLGSFYETGEGVERDTAKALDYYHLAAKYLDPYYDQELLRLVMRRLGDIYRTGELVQADPAQAARYYQAAADAGDLISQAVLYEFGYGVGLDYAQAAGWYLRAANQGQTPAMERLVHFYTEGIGVDKNPDEAARWQRNIEVPAKVFNLPCLVEGQEKPTSCRVVVLERPRNPENPLEEEAERLWEEQRATILPEVIDSFAKLYTLAEELNVSFGQLSLYALVAANQQQEQAGESTGG